MRIADRIGRLERTLGARAHVGVILFHDPDEIPALITKAEREGRAHPAHGLLALPHDIADVATWERDATANARAARMKYPTAPPRTFAASAPAAPVGVECKPGDGLAAAMIVETVGNVRKNIKFCTTHAAALAACDAMNATATEGRYEVAALASPRRR